MDILMVVKPKARGRTTIVYKTETDLSSGDILWDVEEALEDLDIPVDAEVVEDIADTLEKRHNYWLDGEYCFEIIRV